MWERMDGEAIGGLVLRAPVNYVLSGSTKKALVSEVSPRKPVLEIAKEVRELTNEGEFILSGDPRVTVLADRLCPPWLTDLAYYRPDKLQTTDLIEACETYSIRLIVLAFWLANLAEFREFVELSYYLFSSFPEFEDSEEIGYELWFIND